MHRFALHALLFLGLTAFGCTPSSQAPLAPGPDLDHVETSRAFFQAAFSSDADTVQEVRAEAERIAGLFFHTPPETEDMMASGLTNMMLDFKQLREAKADWRLDKVESIEVEGDSAKAIATLRYASEGTDGVRYLTLTLVRLDNGWRIALIN